MLFSLKNLNISQRSLIYKNNMPFDFFSDTLNKHHFKMAHFTETKKKEEKEINWCVPTKWVIIYESTFLFKSRKMKKWLQHTKMASNEEKRRVPLTASTLTKAFLPRVGKGLCDFDQKALTTIELWDYSMLPTQCTVIFLITMYWSLLIVSWVLTNLSVAQNYRTFHANSEFIIKETCLKKKGSLKNLRKITIPKISQKSQRIRR